MLKKKIIGSIMGISIIITSISMPALATETTEESVLDTEIIQEVDSNDHYGPATLYRSEISPYRSFKDYVVYSDKSWIMDGYVGVGGKGWTDIDNKKDGTSRYHSSLIVAYQGSSTFESERNWGYGRVHASTGNLGVGAIKSFNLYYDF